MRGAFTPTAEPTPAASTASPPSAAAPGEQAPQPPVDYNSDGSQDDPWDRWYDEDGPEARHEAELAALLESEPQGTLRAQLAGLKAVVAADGHEPSTPEPSTPEPSTPEPAPSRHGRTCAKCCRATPAADCAQRCCKSCCPGPCVRHGTKARPKPFNPAYHKAIWEVNGVFHGPCGYIGCPRDSALECEQFCCGEHCPGPCERHNKSDPAEEAELARELAEDLTLSFVYPICEEVDKELEPQTAEPTAPEPTAPEQPTLEPALPGSPARATITAPNNKPSAEIESPRTAPRNRRGNRGGRRGSRYPADVEAIRTLFRAGEA